MNQTPQMAELEKVLDLQQAHAEQLRDVLELEWSAISNRNFDDLDRLSSQKTSLSSQLDALESLRSSIASEQNQEGSVLADKWTKLKEAITDIKERNIRNGMLINQCAVHNKQSLTIMFGKSEAKSSTYCPKGAYSGAPTSGTIGRA